MAKRLRNIPYIRPDGTIDPKDFEAWMRDVYDKFSTVGNFLDASLSGGSGITISFNPATGTVTISLTPAEASADVAASSVGVTTADAGGSYTGTVQALINELKSDVNTLVTNLNSAISSLNDLKAKLRTAGLLDT